MAPRGRAAQPSRATRKTNQAKQPALSLINRHNVLLCNPLHTRVKLTQNIVFFSDAVNGWLVFTNSLFKLLSFISSGWFPSASKYGLEMPQLQTTTAPRERETDH